MRSVLRPFLLPLLRRSPDEVGRQLQYFSVATAEGRQLVASVGKAFLGGYHAMLDARTLSEVSAAGRPVEPHFAPFFFEGAAMGYLPRSAYTTGTGRDRVESDLLAMDARFLYLYYVGLGFWYGFRHPNRPQTLEALAPHLDPFYAPLCYDGFGFKLGFFDFPKRPEAREILDRAPASRRAAVYQGFGRALFFVCMDDDSRFEREKAAAPAERRGDLESGRSLAVAFTGLRQPASILAHLAAAVDDATLGDRLLGVTWALTAREMNDPAHFAGCLSDLAPELAALLTLLPRRCREAQAASSDYDEWRVKTKAVAIDAYAAFAGARRP